MRYVFLDDNYDIGHFLMNDLENQKDCHVIYKDRVHHNIIINAFCCSHIIRRINRWLKLPFKKLSYKIILHRYCDTNTKVIAMTSGWYCKKLVDYIKKTYPHAKLVLLLRDTVQSNTERNKEFQIEKVKKQFDRVISYDNIYDVPVYGLTFAPVYMSKSNEIDINTLTCKYDITFIGEAKDRLNIIHRVYQNCTDQGLKSFFYIFRAKKDDQLSDSSVIYKKKYIKRQEFLQKELEANCILEILKGDAYSNTLRFWEAIIYNRKFYTNWKGVVNSPYYDPRYVKVFENPDNLDYNFIKERIEVDYNYQGELSPLRYLDLFEQIK